MRRVINLGQHYQSGIPTPYDFVTLMRILLASQEKVALKPGLFMGMRRLLAKNLPNPSAEKNEQKRANKGQNPVEKEVKPFLES